MGWPWIRGKFNLNKLGAKRMGFLTQTYSTFHLALYIVSWGTAQQPCTVEICPKIPAKEMHAHYDRHHKVSPSPNPLLNTNNSVKGHMKRTIISVRYEVPTFAVACNSGHKWSFVQGQCQ